MFDLIDVPLYLGPCIVFFFFFFNDTATTEIYTLSLHDALPILRVWPSRPEQYEHIRRRHRRHYCRRMRSEEHTSELQSRQYLVCRLLLEKKKTTSANWQNQRAFAQQTSTAA